MSEQSKPDECEKCGQETLEKCPTCDQLVYDKPEDHEVCEACGRELPEESGEEESDYEYEENKNGTMRAVCKCCNRKLDACPKCKEPYVTEDEEEDEQDEDGSDDERSSSKRMNF